jgi:hypothetical protein
MIFGSKKRQEPVFEVIVKTEERREEVVTLPKRTEQEIVEEIHQSFNTEVDKILDFCKVRKSEDSEHQSLLDKVARLEKLGFTNTTEVQSAQAEITRLATVKKENEDKQELLDAVEYFMGKYPYKFITESGVRKICDKYGLLYAPISKYIGTVPDKNLAEIENFKIDTEDEAYCNIDVKYEYIPRDSAGGIFLGRHYREIKSVVFGPNIKGNTLDISQRMMAEIDHIRPGESALVIAAPIKDFEIKENENIVKGKIVSSKTVVKDPVVLRPVIYKNVAYFLVVTAWGLEASDELVANEKMN